MLAPVGAHESGMFIETIERRISEQLKLDYGPMSFDIQKFLGRVWRVKSHCSPGLLAGVAVLACVLAATAADC